MTAPTPNPNGAGVTGPEAPAASADPVASHLLPDTAAVGSRGRLQVGGVDLVDLADDLGTPLFVYDQDHLRRRCQEAVAGFGTGVSYASKAFLCRAMAQLVAEEGMGLDVATGGELSVALAAGVDPGRIVLHGNNKSTQELTDAARLGVRLVIDSHDEIERLGDVLAGLQGRQSRLPVMIRVTPGIEAHTHEFVRTGQTDSKFGFGLETGEAALAAQRIRSLEGLELVGLHAHIGSQIFALDSFGQAVDILAKLVRTLEVPELCIGGGLGVAYVNAERAPSIKDWAATVRSAATAAGIGATITAEPGRAIVATAGLTLYRVGTIKEIPQVRTYVSVDGGMSDNPRPVLYGSGYEAFLPRCPDARRPLAASVVGKHCESGDLVVSDARLPADLAVGDVLCTPVTGAYGYSMASNYNKVPRPAVVFVRDGEVRTVIRREGVDDLARLDESLR
ncbi:MAG: diaminopimelate decarboxylase [Acidimicrobiales bacterium]